MQAGADGEVHLHSLLHSEPLLSIRVSHSSVFQVQWSPARPLVFAAATGTGWLRNLSHLDTANGNKVESLLISSDLCVQVRCRFLTSVSRP